MLAARGQLPGGRRQGAQSLRRAREPHVGGRPQDLVALLRSEHQELVGQPLGRLVVPVAGRVAVVIECGEDWHWWVANADQGVHGETVAEGEADTLDRAMLAEGKEI